jgi:two-component system cell cycle response regulator CtrA
MKVLVAGLDKTAIAFMRQQHGITVDQQDVDGVEDLQMWLQDGIYGVGVIDLERSRLGIYAARGLRTVKINTPIIGVSKGNDDRSWGDHRAMFLENGGDDLLRAPVNPRELFATLRAVTRRASGVLLDVIEFRSGDAMLKVNLALKSATVNGVGLHLTPKEASMLFLLASHPGRVLSKEALLGGMYVDGVDDEPEIKIIDVFVCKLRRKLTDLHPDAGKFIETMWGHGYCFPAQAELKAA